MIFSRKSPATRALHEWMSTLAGMDDIRGNHDALSAHLPAIMAQNPDLECKLRGDRPLAWCMGHLPHSKAMLTAILAQPADRPGALDPTRSIQDVIDMASCQLSTEHVPRALSAVLQWSQNLPPPRGENAKLFSRLVSMHPEVDHQLLEKLRLAGHDPDFPSARGYTVAHSTVANNANRDALNWAIKHCNLEAVDKKGRTALAIAIEVGAAYAVQALIGAGADTRHRSVISIIDSQSAGNRGASPSFLRIRDMVQSKASQASLQEDTVDPIPAPIRIASPRF